MTSRQGLDRSISRSRIRAKSFWRVAFVASLAMIPVVTRGAVPDAPGIPNFARVTERIYRGAQPTPDAWPGLAKLGTQTVIDLRRRREHSIEAESTAVHAAGMRYLNFPMNGFATPTTGQIESVLNLLDRDERIFIHCKFGKDRTGTVIAAYRISREHWTNAQALAEANRYGLHWYERGMKRFLRGYRRDAKLNIRPGVDSTAATGRPKTAR